MHLAAPLKHFVWTLAAQVIGFGAAAALVKLECPLILLPFVASACAGLVARFLGLPAPWLWLNILIPLSVVATWSGSISNALLLTAFVLSFLIYLPTFWTRVPFYPTSQQMYQAILDELPTDKPFRFIDLGCGFGSMLAELAKHRPDGQFEGVEISPLPVLIAKFRFLLSSNKNRVRIYSKSIWNTDLSQYDVVYAFLAPPPMPQLFKKAAAEMRTGTTCLINSFPFPIEADRKRQVHDSRSCILYRYVMKGAS